MEKIIKGIGASVGIAKAKPFFLKKETIEITDEKDNDASKEKAKLKTGTEKTISDLNELKKIAHKKMGKEEAGIFEAHIGMLQDPMYVEKINEFIDEGRNVIYSIEEATKIVAEMFENIPDAYMQERAADIRDIAERLKGNILGHNSTGIAEIKDEVILIAEDLTPSDTVQIDKKYVKGFITKIGGKTSHSAIMAQSIGVPAIVGVGSVYKELDIDAELLMDGNEGVVVINPTKETEKSFHDKQKENEKFESDLSDYINKETITKDGDKRHVAANAGSLRDIEPIQSVNADGIGLFRTEFLYMEASNWPTEEEQFKVYKQLLESQPDNRVVIRMLDIGGDKKLSYFEFPHEENPFLGWRAIRMQFDNPEVFDAQARALLRATPFGKLAINIPMISTVSELKKVKARIIEIEEELKKEGHEVAPYEIGIMVEVPSVVELIDKFIEHVDFVSIGTNDLIQYTFAADRMSEQVAYLYQPYNPSILRKLEKVIRVANEAGKISAICGELASERDLVPLLVGMGLKEFSVSAGSSLAIKKLISMTDYSKAKEIVSKALDCETEEQVKEILDNFKKENYG